MASIQKRVQKTKTSYRVKYWGGRRKENGRRAYDYSSWMDKRKDAQEFLENIGGNKTRKINLKTIHEATDSWLDICEKIGRDGREPVEPRTLKEYRRRAAIIKEYPWQCALGEIKPADVMAFKN